VQKNQETCEDLVLAKTFEAICILRFFHEGEGFFRTAAPLNGIESRLKP
jgi:hypothetical protein